MAKSSMKQHRVLDKKHFKQDVICKGVLQNHKFPPFFEWHNAPWSAQKSALSDFCVLS